MLHTLGTRARARRGRLCGAVGTVRVDVVDRRERLVRRVVGREPARLGAAAEAVLDDQAALALLEWRALDAALEAVRLGLLAHEERLHVGAAGQRRAGRRVGAHGE